MSQLHRVSFFPHVHAKTDSSDLMRDVLIALLPAGVFGVFNFGISALWVMLVCVAAAVLTEWAFEALLKRPVTIGDLSAVVTGLLLAYNLPVSIPLWIAALGSVFAILVVKQLFGGLGQNFMNPALAARCFLLISFGGKMTAFTPGIDGITGATPLAAAKAGETVDMMSVLLGTHAGCIGEVSAIAIVLGGIYMICRRVIAPRIPLVYIGSFSVFVILISLLNGTGIPTMDYMMVQLFGGGLMLGAFFMATDYVTSPITVGGQWIYAIALGALTALFRLVGSSAEGVSYAIIFCNMLVPLMEKFTLPKPFGWKKKEGTV